MNCRVTDIDRIWLRLPYRALPAKHMIREVYHWCYVELCIVTLHCGIQGIGETLPFYTHKPVTDDDVAYVIGRDARELIWDDELGAGLQQALFDAVGKASDVPVYHLLGPKVRDRVPLGWWSVDMSGPELALECADAISAGYTELKTKGRPWFDVFDQCECIHNEVPPYFRVHLDFNEMLLDLSKARRILEDLSAFEMISIFEEPMRISDLAAYETIYHLTRVPIAVHTGRIPFQRLLSSGFCDGLVLGRMGLSARLTQGMAASIATKRICIQLVGTTISTALSLHLGAVLPSATWSAITCHNVYLVQPSSTPLIVSDGMADVPNSPGIGIQLDEAIIEQYRISALRERPYPVPGQLIAIRWPSGGTTYYSHTMQYWEDFMDGRLPIFERGVRLESIPKPTITDWCEISSSKVREWETLQAAARSEAVYSATPIL